MAAATRKKTTTRKKSAARKTSRKYAPKAQEKVGKAMHEMKRGELKAGKAGKTVTNPKQAIAIGLSEARRDGAELPHKNKAE